MAQTGYTPIKIYASSTASAVPLAANLSNVNGAEIAINITDGKLFYKDNTGTVQVIATKNALTNVSSISFGSTGLTPSTATTGAVTVAGTLLPANGGTGITSLGTGVATFLGTPSSANLAAAVTGETGSGALVFGTSPTLVTPILGTPTSATLTNATGLPISTGVSGLGTSVAGALGVNVGTAGSFVVNGGALGTPSSGTVTNLTGTASININGTVGATTANTGAFTTLTASADSSFTSTGALLISKGTTGQQPGSPAVGMIRYNTTNNAFEGYSGASPTWNSIGGATLSNDTTTSTFEYPVFASATSGSASTLYTSNAKYLYKPSTGELQSPTVNATNGIFVNSQTMTTSQTIAAGTSGFTIGPFSQATGAVLTVSSGARHVII